VGHVGRPRGVFCPKVIKRAIKKAGSQSKLGRMIGATRQSISSWKKRIARPSPAFYKKLVRFLSHQT
jgi:DNA-binding XRE family transcriptional regulator